MCLPRARAPAEVRFALGIIRYGLSNTDIGVLVYDIIRICVEISLNNVAGALHCAGRLIRRRREARRSRRRPEIGSVAKDYSVRGDKDDCNFTVMLFKRLKRYRFVQSDVNWHRSPQRMDNAYRFSV